MEQEFDLYDGLVVFERPIILFGESTYGFLFNQELLKKKTTYGNELDTYVSYLTGLGLMSQKGGKVCNNNDWMLNGFRYRSGKKLFHLLSVLLSGSVKYKVYTFDHALELKEYGMEPDECLVFDKKQIEKLIKEATVE